jgi:hypothetical protein
MRKTLFGKFNSPYMENSQNTIDDCYRAYKQDPLGKIELNGYAYSKIISHCRFYGYEDYSYHIVWEPSAELRRNDILIDENGNEFIVRSFEMLRFLGGDIPEWYFKAPPMVITGQNCDLGNYLAKK